MKNILNIVCKILCDVLDRIIAKILVVNISYKTVISCITILIMSILVFRCNCREYFVEVNSIFCEDGADNSNNTSLDNYDVFKNYAAKSSKNYNEKTNKYNKKTNKHNAATYKSNENITNINTTNKTNKNNKEDTSNTIRILIKENNYTTIYHTKIKLKSDKLAVYYNENYKDKKVCNEISIDKNSNYFNNKKIVKIEGKDSITWQRTNGTSIKYKGVLYIHNTINGLVVVNQVNKEDYIAGVIASEMGENAPQEALKAQAICARTYISNIKENQYKKYNALCDDSTSYQVYNRNTAGKKSEEASKITQNLVMKYNNKTINAYYFSTSCGYTTDYKIWEQKKMNYLSGFSSVIEKTNKINNISEDSFKKFIKTNPRAIESEYPFYRWNLKISSEQLLNKIYTITGVNIGKISRITVNKRGTGGIVSQLTIYGDKHQLLMSNQNQIRKALCSYYSKINLSDGSSRTKMSMLPSAFIYIEKISKDTFKIYGGGYGHGCGMSQNGAKEMAKEGLKYEEILKKYYKGIEICPL